MRHRQDLFRPRPKRGSWPFIQVAPVVVLEDPDRSAASRGHSTRFVPLPALGGDLFVDLTVCSTIEKAYLLVWIHRSMLHDRRTDRDLRAAIAAIAAGSLSPTEWTRCSTHFEIGSAASGIRTAPRATDQGSLGDSSSAFSKDSVGRKSRPSACGSHIHHRAFSTSALSVDETPQQVSPAIHQWIADHKGSTSSPEKSRRSGPVDNSFLCCSLRSRGWILRHRPSCGRHKCGGRKRCYVLIGTNAERAEARARPSLTLLIQRVDTLWLCYESHSIGHRQMDRCLATSISVIAPTVERTLVSRPQSRK